MAPVLTSEPFQVSLILALLTQPSSSQHGWVGAEHPLSSRDVQALRMDHLI